MSDLPVCASVPSNAVHSNRQTAELQNSLSISVVSCHEKIINAVGKKGRHKTHDANTVN